MKRSLPVIMFGVVVALAACAQAPRTEEQPPVPSVTGTVNSPDPDFKVLGATMVMIEPSAISTATMTEVIPGLFASEPVAIAADGTFELPLPAAEDIPASVLAPAADFAEIEDLLECPLTASSTTARVSYLYVVGYLNLPGVVFLSIMGSGFSVATTAPVDFEGPGDMSDYTIVSWLFASDDVSVVSGEVTCSFDGTPLTVELDLTAGWNQVALSFQHDPDTGDVTGVMFGNDDAEELYFNLVGAV